LGNISVFPCPTTLHHVNALTGCLAVLELTVGVRQVFSFAATISHYSSQYKSRFLFDQRCEAHSRSSTMALFCMPKVTSY